LSQDQSSVTALRGNLGSSISCNIAKITSCKTADIVKDMTSTTMDNGNGWKIPLHMSAENGHDRCVRAMLDSGADVDAVNSTGLTALHLAARNGHIGVMKMLLRQDANIDATDESGWTALHHAANNDCEAIVRLSTNRGADLNAKARDRGPR